LKEAGWKVEKTVKYRYDVVDVGEWYAEVVEDPADGGHAWFDLELGIVVNQERVPLLPVLVQLIRNAPQRFQSESHRRPWRRGPDAGHPARRQRAWPCRGAGQTHPEHAGRVVFQRQNQDLAAHGHAGRRAPGRTGPQRRIAGPAARNCAKWARAEQFGAVKRVATPAGLQATLRDYQSDGLSWMQFLREYGFAGILADDMGLGKTVQTLAHILVEKEAGRLTAPALVIAPTSLMGNWQEEAARFAPGLRVLLLQGKDRMGQFDQIDESDLVLTTYALLPRDEEKLREHDFHLVILDESHYIKNTRSKAAQSAGLLKRAPSPVPVRHAAGKPPGRAVVAIPLPAAGPAGRRKRFNTVFRHPIERQDDPLRRALLNRRIKPFLLRRTKDNVAKELPPKTEMVRKVELTGAQRDLYETVRLAMDQKVRDEIDRKGVARSQIVILEALLKLRQVCCDPRLVKSLPSKKQTAGSAKLIDLMQMVEDLLEENRKILVFSQFTSMLELIEEELEARDIPYALLTGDTKDRSAQVAAFQQGAVPIFLISLKAGGVGLNLTAADTVIHYDPWWNPAAENQATDRAWRIGQDKPVFVYKLIAKGTLEEKIQVLQQKKSDLAQSILAEGESQKMALTQEDLQQIFAPLVNGIMGRNATVAELEAALRESLGAECGSVLPCLAAGGTACQRAPGAGGPAKEVRVHAVARIPHAAVDHRRRRAAAGNDRRPSRRSHPQALPQDPGGGRPHAGDAGRIPVARPHGQHRPRAPAQRNQSRPPCWNRWWNRRAAGAIRSRCGSIGLPQWMRCDPAGIRLCLEILAG
jgi:superfamily II DNA or RNA helicase